VSLEAAQHAQVRGMSIFPVQVRGKRPHHMAGEWSQTATSDYNAIGHFWTHIDPQANVGIACKQSQLLVVDCDKAKSDWNLRDTPEYAFLHSVYGPRVDGEDLLDEIVFRNSPLPETYSVRTGSGGLHLYFRWPASWPKASQASIVKGLIDIRSNGGTSGGYVLGAGSRTDDEIQPDGTVKPGGPYEALNDIPPELPPQWLRLLVVEKAPVRAPSGPGGIQQPGAISFSGLQETVRTAAPGNRNNALLFCARAMCSDKATEQECLNILGPEARKAGLGDFEIEQTIGSAYRLQRQKEGL
jgi:hypothetical protein